ncbi:hypothetical protein Pmani_020971 [Petrolisthes manimaculis]|uniref:Uncharacterized protein n=1 Tax=Petrolisthes manimaculis TaxID=1843537 RepID=A0AAE1PF52_9EUCA|nr:hypothetical protein Pmani_020971 [Petrolisthes manimaculis]
MQRADKWAKLAARGPTPTLKTSPSLKKTKSIAGAADKNRILYIPHSETSLQPHVLGGGLKSHSITTIWSAQAQSAKEGDRRRPSHHRSNSSELPHG